jgi:hypothetical protein
MQRRATWRRAGQMWIKAGTEEQGTGEQLKGDQCREE